MKFSITLTDLPVEHKWQMIMKRLNHIGFKTSSNRNGIKVSGETNNFEMYIEATRKTIEDVYKFAVGNTFNYSNAVIPDMELQEIMKEIDAKNDTNLVEQYSEQIQSLNKLYNTN